MTRHRFIVVLSVGFSACGDDAPKQPDAAAAIDAPADADGDGFVADDCNDNDPNVHPGAAETCDGRDDDCDTKVDEGIASFVGIDGIPFDVSPTFDTTAAGAPANWEAPPGGGVLHLCAGTFYTHIVATDNFEIDGLDATSTILDGDASGTVVSVNVIGGLASIHDVTIRNGAVTSTSGGGIKCDATNLHVDHAVVTNNRSSVGGGVALDDCTTEILDTVIDGNHGVNGVGLYANGGTTTLTRVRVTGNVSTPPGSSQASGSGILAARRAGTTVPHLDLVDTLITGNSGAVQGALNTQISTTCTGSMGAIIANAGSGVFLVGSVGNFNEEHLSSNGCDFGTNAATDNTPHDIEVPKTSSTYEYGDNATFECTSTACTP